MADDKPPRVAVFAGINGAGKSTASRHILVNVLGINTFTNADAIARGLNGINPEGEAIRASRVMLAHLHEQAAAREDIAFETTLAARTYAGWLRGLRDAGYEVYLYYFWLDSPEAAIERVAARVRAGGHHIPEPTIRQRYARTIRNFFDLYQPICSAWHVYDNSGGGSRLVAWLTAADGEVVRDPDTWVLIRRSAGYE